MRAYRNVFPALFTNGDEMDEDLRAHLRYPEDLFRVQSNMYTRWHMTEGRVFFNNGDPWQIARDPSTISGSISTVTSSSSRSLPSRKWEVIPVPWPITAALRALGTWASGMSAIRA